MNELFVLIIDPLQELYKKLSVFSLNFLAMVVIISAGTLLAWLVKFVLFRILKAIKFDKWCDRMGFTVIIRKGDVWAKPSVTLAAVVFWILFLLVVMVGLSALNIAAIDTMVAQFFHYLPRFFSAILILIFGYLIAGFIGRAVLIAAVNSGYRYAGLLAEAVRILLMIFIFAMALEQLQVAPNIVVATFSILFAGIVIALAVSFGVAGIDYAKKIIEKEDEQKEKETKDIQHL